MVVKHSNKKKDTPTQQSIFDMSKNTNQPSVDTTPLSNSNNTPLSTPSTNNNYAVETRMIQMEQQMQQMTSMMQWWMQQQQLTKNTNNMNDKQLSTPAKQRELNISVTNDAEANNIEIQQSPVVKTEPMMTSIVQKMDVKKPDDFLGDGKVDVEKWIKQLEIYQQLVNITESTKVNHTMMYLKGQALDWGYGHDFEDFAQFKRMIIARFGTKEKSLHAL
jgi:hypothetical protein